MEILREKRKEQKITQDELARLVGISRQYYCDLENGSKKPSVALAKKISKTLGIEWTIFFT